MKYIKQKKLIILSLILLIITIYFRFNNAIIFTRYINPLLWLGVLVYVYYIYKNKYIRQQSSKYLIYKMIILTIIYLICYFYIGFIFGFVKSLYSHSLKSIIRNIFEIMIPIIGIEYLRGIVVSENKKNRLLLIGLVLIFFLIEIKYNNLLSLYSNKESLFKYICSTIIPTLAGSLIYTYLSYKSSYKLPLIYRSIIQLVLILIPIVPDINWFITGSLGILIPAIIYLLFKYRYFKREIKNERGVQVHKVWYVATIIIASLLVSFMLGLFKYEPVAVLSNSMSPVYVRGDAIIYQKLDNKQYEKLSEGTIIVYKLNNQIITHRIVDVIKENNSVKYRTKGDFNDSYDINLVEPSQIKGVYLFKIKYIGFPSVWLNEYFNKTDAVVETK